MGVRDTLGKKNKKSTHDFGAGRGAGPCLGGLVPQRRQAAFLGAPQHRAAAVGLCGAICHREAEVRDAAQVRPAGTHKGTGHDERAELSSSRNLSIRGTGSCREKAPTAPPLPALTPPPRSRALLYPGRPGDRRGCRGPEQTGSSHQVRRNAGPVRGLPGCPGSTPRPLLAPAGPVCRVPTRLRGCRRAPGPPLRRMRPGRGSVLSRLPTESQACVQPDRQTPLLTKPATPAEARAPMRPPRGSEPRVRPRKAWPRNRCARRAPRARPAPSAPALSGETGRAASAFAADPTTWARKAAV